MVALGFEDRIWQRINGWRDFKPSKAGKEILIKAVLQSIPTYAMSCFKFLEHIIDDIQKMISAYNRKITEKSNGFPGLLCLYAKLTVVWNSEISVLLT